MKNILSHNSTSVFGHGHSNCYVPALTSFVQVQFARVSLWVCGPPYAWLRAYWTLLRIYWVFIHGTVPLDHRVSEVWAWRCMHSLVHLYRFFNLHLFRYLGTFCQIGNSFCICFSSLLYSAPAPDSNTLKTFQHKLSPVWFCLEV